MRPIENVFVVALLAAVLGLVGPAPAAAEDGPCRFSLAGAVERVWCLEVPEPPPAPCYLRVLVEVDGEITGLGAWCHDEMAAVCAGLEPDLPVLVLGEDDGEVKHATHVAVWLAPEAVATGLESKE